VSRLRAVARDVRALGAGAPLRAAYDGSKRLGGHTVAFGALTRRPPSTAVSRPVYDLPTPSAAAVERTCQAADEIVAGTVVLYGEPIAVGDDPDWHASYDPAAPEVRWPEGPWWQIDVRLAARVADIKWVWELGRHRHLVVLARAAASPDPDPAWIATLRSQLTGWLRQNPVEQGVHWASNLEVALRAMAWLEVLQHAGDQLPTDLRRDLDAHLFHSGAHLLLELPYTLSTMRNNHLLGDAVGLIALARAFPDEPESHLWEQAGTRLLDTYVDREVRPDGSMVEDSVSYHRFVIELLCRRLLLGDAPAGMVAAVDRSARFLCRLGALDGPVPQYGDWDEGRAIAVAGDPTDLRGSTRLALALAGSGAPASWRDEHDELAWYVAEGQPAVADRVEGDGHSIGGGIARVARGPLTVWCKAGGGPWHGHADHTSVSVRAGSTWLVGDPGTGNYNGRDESRTYLRSSAAHSVLVLDGEDQLVPHRAFRWVHSATGRVGAPVALPGGGQLAWCAHDAYRRLSPRRRVARVVATCATGVVVADWVEGPPGLPWSLALPFAPGAVWDDGRLTTADGTTATLSLLTDGVDIEPADGPWSATYGHTETARRLVATGNLGGPVAWSIALSPGGDAPMPASHPTNAPFLHGDVLTVGGAAISICWRDGAVELDVHHPELGPTPRPFVVLR